MPSEALCTQTTSTHLDESVISNAEQTSLGVCSTAELVIRLGWVAIGSLALPRDQAIQKRVTGRIKDVGRAIIRVETNGGVAPKARRVE